MRSEPVAVTSWDRDLHVVEPERFQRGQPLARDRNTARDQVGVEVERSRALDQPLEIVGEHLNEIDLIISDVVMPRIDGPTMVKEVRARRADLPVIFISGYAEDAFRRRIDAGEEVNFLLKPFTLKQLAAKVKEVLEPHTERRRAAN